MSHTGILTRVEMETMGPPVPEELSDTDVPASFLCDLALKLVAQMPEPTTSSVSAELCMPRALVEELLHHLSRLKEYGITTFQAEDEIAAICAAIGASFLNGSTVSGHEREGRPVTEEERVNTFDEYRRRTPEKIFGGSIYLFREDGP